MAMPRWDPRTRVRVVVGPPTEYKDEQRAGQVKPCRRCRLARDGDDGRKLVGLYTHGMRILRERRKGASGIALVTDSEGDLVTEPHVYAENTHKECEREYGRKYYHQRRAKLTIATTEAKAELQEIIDGSKNGNDVRLHMDIRELKHELKIMKELMAVMLKQQAVRSEAPKVQAPMRQEVRQAQRPAFNAWTATQMPGGARASRLTFDDKAYTTDAEHKKILEMLSRPDDPEEMAEHARVQAALAQAAPGAQAAPQGKSRVYMGEPLE